MLRTVSKNAWLPVPEKGAEVLSILLFLTYVGFLASLVFSFRAISSLAIPSFVVLGIIYNRRKTGRMLSPRLLHALVIYCFLLFVLELLSLTHTQNLREGWRNIYLKSAYVALVVSFFCCDYLNESTGKKIMNWYCCSLLGGSLVAVVWAALVYLKQNDPSVFLYHKLVSIYSGHAIQYSILVFVAQVHLLEMLKRKEWLINKAFHGSAFGFLVLFLLLLSSKLVITFFVIYFIFFLFRIFKSTRMRRRIIFIAACLFIVLFSLIFFTSNPVNNRFREIVQTDFQFLQKETYSPGVYFNGLQFRMLQWRFVPAILDGHHSWFTGAGVGDAQGLLDQKYVSSNMYIGTRERGDKGFIGYNTHDEFLEALLQTGIPGLVAFILITWTLIRMAFQRNRMDLFFVTALLILYSLTESVLETQYSIDVYFFFPLFFHFKAKTGATKRHI